jgi:hypothetical protein
MQRPQQGPWVSGAGPTRTSAARRLITLIMQSALRRRRSRRASGRVNKPTAMLIVDRIKCPSIAGGREGPQQRDRRGAILLRVNNDVPGGAQNGVSRSAVRARGVSLEHWAAISSNQLSWRSIFVRRAANASACSSAVFGRLGMARKPLAPNFSLVRPESRFS